MQPLMRLFLGLGVLLGVAGPAWGQELRGKAAAEVGRVEIVAQQGEAAAETEEEQAQELPFWIVVAVFGAWAGVYGLVYWRKPLWLLNLAERQEKILGAIPESDKFGFVMVRLGLTTLLDVVLPGKYAPRVLDAWVAEQLQQTDVMVEFAGKATVTARQIHISMPVKLQGQMVPEFAPEALQKLFQKTNVRLLIHGEGGSGKTSLACQIARWGLEKQLAEYRLLPVLIETEFPVGAEGENAAQGGALVQAINTQLKALLDLEEPLEAALLEQLLRQRRVLVIVDHFSELSPASRAQVPFTNPRFPVNALVMTSRLENELEGLSSAKLEPLRIEGNRLSQFVNAYLEAQQKRDLLEDKEFFSACGRLSEMVEQRDATVLLVKLYVEQLLAQQRSIARKLATNVPELMLNYVQQLNGSVDSQRRRDVVQVQAVAKVVAWCCVRMLYRPTEVDRQVVEAELQKRAEAGNLSLALPGETGDASPLGWLQYLEDPLRLVQTVGAGNRVRLVLDPLAEYLAALDVVGRYQANQADWDGLLSEIAQQEGAPGTVKGFLLALRDCCETEIQPTPTQLVERLGSEAGLDLERLATERKKRRIQKLVDDLLGSEVQFQEQAIQNLRTLGEGSRQAFANLLTFAIDKQRDKDLRQEALQAALHFQNSCDLSEAETEEVKKLLWVLLRDSEEFYSLRARSSYQLRQIGEDSPIVVVESAENQEQVLLLPAPQSRVVRLPLGITLDLVEIPAGEFWMGSEEGDKDERSRYQVNDEWPRHQVNVPQFWMGWYPVTQAQWRSVAENLPQIDHELDLNPSRFKGNDLPVEKVSWYEAQEFCRRLSQYCSETFALPTEAEWEYAARAGTKTAYHFGDEITPDLANYDENINQTTPVGQYRLANRFGLYDIHGNVWEWCQDEYHESYAEKPDDSKRDGSIAWADSFDVLDGNLPGVKRTLRGGSWGYDPEFCRSAVRAAYAPDDRAHVFGFRVVCRRCGLKTP